MSPLRIGVANTWVWVGTRKAIRVLGLTAGALLLCVPLFSQGNLVRISGTITDQSGGVISGATVTVKDVERGISRTLTTGDAGEYNAPNMLPGTYAVRAESKGFKAVERTNILLEVGKEVHVDLTLEPGEATMTITVTEASPMVETSNATLGGTLSNETINDLPLNGRNFVNLFTMRPGMEIFLGGGGDTRVANGTRTEDIDYLVDGVRAVDPYRGQSVLNAAIPAGDTSTSLPIDAIQEFNTEHNPKAEFGWKPGAIVNTGVKSGSNTIHGTAFAFGRETVLDARNFFNYQNQPVCATVAAICNKAPVGLEQFGGSFGGPIKKDKMFYFVNYEGQRYNVTGSRLVNAPTTVSLATPGNPAGNPGLSLIDACNSLNPGHLAFGAAGNPITPLSAQIAGLNPDCSVKPPNYTPGPSESFFPTNPSTIGIPLAMVSNNAQDNFVGKFDYKINDHNTLAGMYFHGKGGGQWNDFAYEVGIPGSSNSPFMSNLFGYVQVGSGAWTYTPNSTVVNEFRVGYSHQTQKYDSIDASVNPLAYGINTGVTDSRVFGFPFIRINPFSSGNFRFGGNWPKHTGPDGSLQFLDHVSILHGNHTFKFGGEILANTAEPFITANAKGSIRFTTLQTFLTGSVRSTGTLSSILVGDPARHLSNQGYAAFVQDDWRVTKRLTLNLGVRYELQTVLKDRDNLIGNFDPVLGLVQVGSGELSAFHGDHNKFSPRVGFAWDVSGNGKTVIRGGGSIMPEELPYNMFMSVGNLLGLGQVPTGATKVVCSATPCVSGTSSQVRTAGSGNMNVLSENVAGSAGLTAGWQKQTVACVSGGTTACGSIFPASIFAIQCGDGLTFTPAGASSAVTDPAPCNTEAVDPNVRLPYISTWTLDIQRAITNNLSLQVAYVGNHGTKLMGFANINQPPLGSGNTNLASCVVPVGSTPNAANCEQVSRPFFAKFPYLAQIDRLSNQSRSNYNGLQVTLTERPSHGLSFLVGYTYAHALDNASANYNANPMPVDSSHPTALYGNSDFDIRHRFTMTVTYLLPGRKSPGQLLEGWQLNSAMTLQTGAPWSARDTSNDFSGTGQVSELNSFGQIWNFTGNTADFTSKSVPIPCWSLSGSLGNCSIGGTTPPAVCTSAATTPGQLAELSAIGCYVSLNGKSVLTPPALGTIGTAGRNIFRDSGFKNWDLSVMKATKIKEKLTAQFRAEFFNILNHPTFINPGGPTGAGFNDPSGGQTANFGCSCSTPDQGPPNPVLGTGANRSIQLGLKLIW